jgi:FkbH-like protein
MGLKLNEALAALRTDGMVASRCELFLACGFQALHLATFLKAHFALRFPNQAADILEGLYGDLGGTLDSAARSSATAAVVVIEWPDLDSRLGLRSTGGWGLSVEQDILATSSARWASLLQRLTVLSARMPVALVLPTLPILMFGHTAGGQMGSGEMELLKQSATFLTEAGRLSNIRVLHPVRLARESPEASRRDPTMDLAAGFPYSIGHASVLAEQVIELLYPRTPMKGLISDLDDTLWAGIVGDDGVRAVNWTLQGHAQIHGLYQQQLRHLSEMGVLLAIASKNEMAIVEEALRREDLYIPAASFFPVKASWGSKSQAVAEILQSWNIGAESVVFVDDNPMEIEEVQAAFPSMTCLAFPRRSPAKVLNLFAQLRDLFGKPSVHLEDTLRQSSIRANAHFQEATEQSANDGFLQKVSGKVTVDARKSSVSRRLLELINKTNQFNLNGCRIAEGDWLRQLEDNTGFTAGISYEDKFGPLGLIAVIAGRQQGDLVEVTHWVLSCRAFSRKIEHHILEYLFSGRGAATVRLAFHPTDRNGPLREFLGSLGMDSRRAGSLDIQQAAFRLVHSSLPHEVRTLENE